jgi:putative hydrolases of HD superfamily
MNEKPAIQRLFDLQALLHQFHFVERSISLPGQQERRESDTEHSYTLAMTAWFLAQYFPELDTNTCIRLALVHDLVEIYAGDTFAYAQGKYLGSKSTREQAALDRIAKEWHDFPEMVSAIQTYEELVSDESCFVYALDKLMPPIVNFMTEGTSWKKTKSRLTCCVPTRHPKFKNHPKSLRTTSSWLNSCRNVRTIFIKANEI